MAAAARDDKSVDREATLRAVLATVAPGTPLRDGLERILRGRTGALIVLGHDRTVESLCTGGFALDVDFSATGLRELSKMDGAVVLDRDATRILRANVQLVPDPTIPTEESGTRHRTAERVAKQTGFPVISVSQSMHIIALYVAGRRYVLEDSARDPVAGQPGAGHARALQDAPRRGDRHPVRARDRGPRHRARRRARSRSGWRWCAASRARSTATSSSSAPTAACSSLQLDELIAGVDSDRELVVRDYAPAGGRKQRQVDADASTDLDALDSSRAARPHGRGAGARPRRRPTRRSTPAVTPRGYRLLAKVPRLPALVVDRLVDHFGGLQQPARRQHRRPAGRRRASARAGPAPSARGCRGSPSRASSSATSERSGARG